MIIIEGMYENLLKTLLRRIEAGEDVNITENRYTALGCACILGDTWVVKSLLRMKKIDVNLKTNFFQRTALMYACVENHIDIVELLIKAGANVNDTDLYGRTAMIGLQYPDIVELLIIKKADVDIQDHSGSTALIKASIYGYLYVVKILINANANLFIKDTDGKTALDYAKESKKTNHLEIIKLLENAEESIRKKDIFREFCGMNSVKVVYRNDGFEESGFNFNFCNNINPFFTENALNKNKYLLKLEAESDRHLGAILAFSIYHDKVYVDLLCTNKTSAAGYSDDGAGTILLNFLMEFVDFMKKRYKYKFYLQLTSVDEAVDYYFRKNFNPMEKYYYKKNGFVELMGDIPMQYGQSPDKVKLTQRHKQLKLLRSDGNKSVKRLKNLGVRSKRQQKKLDTILKTVKRKSKRLNPLKKYKYEMTLIVKWDYEKHFPEKYDYNRP